MSRIFVTLQKRYQALVARSDEAGADYVEEVRTFVADAREAGASITDLNERSQLRTWIRFFASVLYDATGEQPDVSLQPLARGQLVALPPERMERRSLPALSWVLLGAAAVVVVGGLFLLLGGGGSGSSSSTPSPAMPAGSIEVGAEPADGGGPALPATVFCSGTTRLFGRFSIPEPLPADTRWSWQLSRAGEAVASGPATAWDTGSVSQAAAIALPGDSPFEAGQYELEFLVDGRPVANRVLEVLAQGPRVRDVQVSAVPGGAPRTEFTLGVRILYVAYSYENLCAGRSITRTVTLDGEVVHVSSEPAPAAAGDGQLVYHGLDEQPLAGGEYRVTVDAGEGGEQSVAFRVASEVDPTISGIRMALGALPDGTPIHLEKDIPFNWNTKVVYAVFDYAGMRDGVPWEARWMLDGVEVRRQSELWDAECDGVDGTTWVAHYDARGWLLPSGAYSVTLTVDGALQSQVDFVILAYATPTPEE